MRKQFKIDFSYEYPHKALRMGSSDELVWLKRAFLTVWHMCYMVNWKNMFGKAKIAIKQSVRTAVLCSRIAGEVAHA